MREIENIGNEGQQRFTIQIPDGEVILNLRFLPMVQIWVFSVEFGSFSRSNVPLTLGVPHIVGANQPFDFVVDDQDGSGLDPFRLNDFVDGRIKLYLLDSDDMESVRGVPVP